MAWPIYDWMGVAKAALESVSRYLARDLGPAGIRVNLVSAGPLGTVAARGIPGFEQLAELWRAQAPLGWDVEDPGPVARAICWLLSEYAQGISGEIVHVDGGFHAVGAPSSELPAAPHQACRLNGTGPRVRAQQRLDAGTVARRDVASGAADQDRRLHSVLGPDQIGGGGELVGDGDPSRAQLPAGRVAAATPVVERFEAGAADGDVDLAVAPRAAEGVGDQDRGGSTAQLGEASPDAAGGAIGVGGEENERVGVGGVGGVDPGVGADKAVMGDGDQHPVLGAANLAGLVQDDLDLTGILSSWRPTAWPARSVSRSPWRRVRPSALETTLWASTSTSPAARPAGGMTPASSGPGRHRRRISGIPVRATHWRVTRTVVRASWASIPRV